MLQNVSNYSPQYKIVINMLPACSFIYCNFNELLIGQVGLYSGSNEDCGELLADELRKLGPHVEPTARGDFSTSLCLLRTSILLFKGLPKLFSVCKSEN